MPSRQESNSIVVYALAEEVVFQDTVDGTEAVPPVDFLAFSVSAAVVGNTYFIYADARDAGDFGGHLGLKAKPLLTELQALNRLSAEQLVAGLHIGQVEVGHGIRKESQEFIADRVPKE